MKGNTLGQFLDDLLSMGGPEKEFEYRGKTYFLETIRRPEKRDLDELYIIECTEGNPFLFRCWGKNFRECVEQFEKAKIFDGRTIYEAEDEIEVTFG